MMKPKAQSEHEEGMLEYLEDIIGSSRFKEPIEQLANEVETLNEARGEKVISLIPDKGKYFRIKFFESCLFVTLMYTIVTWCKKVLDCCQSCWLAREILFWLRPLIGQNEAKYMYWKGTLTKKSCIFKQVLLFSVKQS